LLPLADSLIHTYALQQWFPGGHALVANWLGGLLLAAHIAFWYVAMRKPEQHSARDVRTRRVAVALMLLFYSTLAGIALQRIPAFGLDYLHQPRYVLFYQLNLAALGMMTYAAAGNGTLRLPRRVGTAGAMASLTILAVLQWHLSLRSWNEARYLSSYLEGAATTLGALAEDPSAQIPCADILRVCDFPTDKRREMLQLLQIYKLNIFNPGFQALYRLHPTPARAMPSVASDTAAPPAP